ncbi:MAG: SDR family NAD(P)-dependent oxidoreductase, partial [Flavobacteriales bacterium]|nr:SDR family NAD(P)-dependent oxidoreductase [Flavobacteriales bacterium]
MTRTILITGGAGFIGSHVVRRFVQRYHDVNIVNLDALTYAGNLENLRDVESAHNYAFVKGDIREKEFVIDLFNRYKFDGVIHLAAESHVDRSIENPEAFITTNILGTVNLLSAASMAWGDNAVDKRFYHVSTDEVYGSLHDAHSLFSETTPYDPKSPYSASKASSDHFVRAWHNTY